MSIVRTNSVQIGQSVTATNNGTWYQPGSPDGTIRYAVGNAGSTSLDVLTLNNSGQVTVSRSLTVTKNINVSGNTVATDLSVSGQATVNKATVSNLLTVSGNTVLGASGKTISTTGLLSHTGRATVSTNLSVSGNTNVTGVIAQSYGTMTFPVQPIVSFPVGKTKTTFICTGALQSFTVPSSITAILVKLWGAGGAGGNSGGWSNGSRGGGGGHTIGIIPVTSGAIYYIVVGQGGQTNWSGGTAYNYGNGGGFASNSDNRYCGQGGGFSGIFTSSSITQGNAVMIAGGGGGGGSSRMRDGNWGGAGGGSVGQSGHAAYDSRYDYAGTGGTQSGGGTNSINSGNNGGALTGGIGRSDGSPYGGGGGGGYYGGAGGQYVESNTMAPAGGGSGYVHPTLTQYAATFTGTQFIPAMFFDPDLPKTLDGYNNWSMFAMGGDPVASGGQYTQAGGGSGFCCIYY